MQSPMRNGGLIRVTRQISEHLPGWSMARVATAIQAMRGAALITAVTIVAGVGDFSRFGNPRQLMAYLGLVPSEHLQNEPNLLTRPDFTTLTA
jgi:transposase